MVAWLKQTKIKIWNWAFKAIFYFTKSFLTRSTLSPLGKYLWKELFKFPQVIILFLTPSFQNLGLNVVPLAERGRFILCSLKDVYRYLTLQNERVTYYQFHFEFKKVNLKRSTKDHTKELTSINTATKR